jgi:hypothetical protein
MNGSANVQSLAAITATKAALVTFAEQVQQALAMIDVESRRMLEWLEHDRPRFWRMQVREATDEVTQAKAALHRCLMYPVTDERPSCREERAALKKAEAKLAYCQEKAERLQHWKRELQHELFQYQGRIGQLVRLVESDVPEAIHVINKLLARLEEYKAVRVSGGRAAYDDKALASQLWPEDSSDGQPEEEAEASDESAEPPPASPGVDPTTVPSQPPAEPTPPLAKASRPRRPNPLPKGEGIIDEERTKS